MTTTMQYLQKILNALGYEEPSVEVSTPTPVSQETLKASTQTTSKQTTTSTPAKTEAKAVTVGSKINAGSAPIYWDSYGTVGPYGSHQYYSSDPVYYVVKENNGYVLARHHTQSAAAGWFKKSDVTAMATGGYTGDNEGFAMLHKKERVLSAKQTEAFETLVNDYLPVLTNSFIRAKTSSLGVNTARSDSGNTFTGDINVSFELPNVTDTASFMKELQSNKQFATLMQHIVLDPVLGKGSLTKNKTRVS
jgi:hypothetical protein